MARKFANSRADGDGSALTGWSRKPVSIAHQIRSFRPISLGAHGARPHERNTSRSASTSSSAIWQPVWPLPITSTWPSGSASGLR